MNLCDVSQDEFCKSLSDSFSTELRVSHLHVLCPLGMFTCCSIRDVPHPSNRDASVQRGDQMLFSSHILFDQSIRQVRRRKRGSNTHNQFSSKTSDQYLAKAASVTALSTFDLPFFYTFLLFDPQRPEGFLRLSPGYIISGGLQAIRFTCVLLSTIWGEQKCFLA